MQLELALSEAPIEARAVRGPRGLRILALHLPLLSLERALRARGQELPALGPSRTPVALVLDGKVVLCDPSARAAGVHPGASAVQAQAACDRLVVLPYEPKAELAALEAIAEAVLVLAPRVELVLPDVLLLDASAAPLLAGAEASGTEAEAILAERTLALVAGFGHRCLAAVADGRRPARALARHADRPLVMVEPGRTAAALAPLPLSALELAPHVEAQLRALGFRQLGALAALPPESLAHRFGREALEAIRLARGEDDSRLSPYVPDTLPEESIDLEGSDAGAIESAEPLLFAIKRLADRLAARLAGRGMGAARLEVALQLDRALWEEAQGPGRTGAPEVRFPLALARPSAAAAVWILPLKEWAAGLVLHAPVVKLRLAVTEAAPLSAEQLAIGDRPEAQAALENALARLAGRLGPEALFAAEPADRHRPEAAYHVRPFLEVRRARAGGWRRRPAPSAAAGEDAALEAQAARPLRLLAEPLALQVDVEDGRITALQLQGRIRPVGGVVGPERLRGEWWSAPYDRDYYRVEVGGLGSCWIFRNGRDGGFYLHGFFD
jgi:protein ImuB